MIQTVGQSNSGGGHERVVTLDLEGELGLQEMEEILELVVELTTRGVLGVVLDFSEVRHFHYRGVKPLLEQTERMREAGGDIKLCGLSPYLRAIFRSVGAHESFEFFADAPEARTAFQPLSAVFS